MTQEPPRSSRVGVWSEAGKLRRVLVCSPGLAHLRLTPDTCHELLFDDVLWVSAARRDHFDFVSKMRERGIEVLELLDMVTDVVEIPTARTWILDRKITEGTSKYDNPPMRNSASLAEGSSSSQPRNSLTKPRPT